MTWSIVPCSDATAASKSCRPHMPRPLRLMVSQTILSRDPLCNRGVYDPSLDGVFLLAISSRRPPPTTPSFGLLPLQPRTSPAGRPQLRCPHATPPRCLPPPVLLTISIVTGVPRRRRPDKSESYPRPRALPSPPPLIRRSVRRWHPCRCLAPPAAPLASTTGSTSPLQTQG
jgi:hypothetical protein